MKDDSVQLNVIADIKVLPRVEHSRGLRYFATSHQLALRQSTVLWREIKFQDHLFSITSDTAINLPLPSALWPLWCRLPSSKKCWRDELDTAPRAIRERADEKSPWTWGSSCRKGRSEVGRARLVASSFDRKLTLDRNCWQRCEEKCLVRRQLKILLLTRLVPTMTWSLCKFREAIPFRCQQPADDEVDIRCGSRSSAEHDDYASSALRRIIRADTEAYDKTFSSPLQLKILQIIEMPDNSRDPHNDDCNFYAQDWPSKASRRKNLPKENCKSVKGCLPHRLLRVTPRKVEPPQETIRFGVQTVLLNEAEKVLIDCKFHVSSFNEGEWMHKNVSWAWKVKLFMRCEQMQFKIYLFIEVHWEHIDDAKSCLDLRKHSNLMSSPNTRYDLLIYPQFSSNFLTRIPLKSFPLALSNVASQWVWLNLGTSTSTPNISIMLKRLML